MPHAWEHLKRELRERPITNGVELAAARKELYRGLADRVKRLPGIHRSNIRLVDQSERELRFAATAGEGWTPEKKRFIYCLDKPGMGAQVVAMQTAIYLPIVKGASHYVPLFDDVQSEYCAPIKLRKRVVAVLTASSAAPNGISPLLQDTIKTVAGECAQALEHFELLEEGWILSLLAKLSKEHIVEGVCETAVQEIQSIFGASMVSLLVYEPLTDRLQLKAYTRKSRKDPNLRYLIGEGLTGWVAQHRKTLRIRDYRDTNELTAIDPNLKRANLNDYEPPAGQPAAYLGTSLTIREDLIGVIRLSNKTDHGEFLLEEEARLEQIAEHLALKIATIREIDTKGKIVRLSRALCGHLELQEAGTIMAEGISEITGAYCVVIRLLEGERRKLLAVTPQGENLPEYLEADDPFPPGIFIDKEQFHSDCSPFEKWNIVRASYPILAHACSFAYMPLKVQQMVGTISLFWKGKVSFDEDRCNSIASLAGLIAICIEACRRSQKTIDEAKLSADVIDDLHRVGIEFSQTRDIMQLYRQILIHAKRIAGVDIGTFRECSNNDLIGRASDGIEESLIVNTPLPLSALSVIREALESGIPILVDNLETEEYRALKIANTGRYRDMLNRTKSMILVPIKLQGVPLAMVFLDSETKLALAEPRRKYLEILAGYAAIAIDGARLHADKEERLRLAEPLGLLGQMLSGYLHVVGSPLQSLCGAIDVIGHPGFDAKCLPERLKAIKTYLAALKTTVEDLKLLAQSNKALTDDRIELSKVVVKFCNEFSWLEGPRPDAISTDSNLWITGNEAQIRNALGMVVTNAIEARGAITIQTGCSESECWVTVTDNGEGMTPDVRDRCLETFYSTKEAIGGSGLGLAVANGVMKKHGGRVEIESEPGKGTQVKLIFPKK